MLDKPLPCLPAFRRIKFPGSEHSYYDWPAASTFEGRARARAQKIHSWQIQVFVCAKAKPQRAREWIGECVLGQITARYHISLG